MLHPVPALPRRNVTQAKVGGKIDHPHPFRKEPRRLFHRDAVGCGEEDEIALLQWRFIGMSEKSIDAPPERREKRGNGCACLAARGDRMEHNLRMSREKAQKLYARVTCSANDTDTNHRTSK
ncbi:hypothetical protein JCM16106_07560 [Hydrogenophilus islandicus]